MPRDRREIDRLHDEIQDLFAELWQVPHYMGRRGFRPHVDAYRTPDPPQLTIVVEAPGIDPGAVHVTVEGQSLVVAGERARPRIDGQAWLNMELDYGSFQRSFRLPDDVDGSGATADYDRGLLTIVLPIVSRQSGAAPVPIEVRARR